jgi:peptidyl-tRNA hydrolase
MPRVQASGDSGYESDESGEAAPAAPAGQRRGGGGGSALGGPREELKMVLVVNSELKMGKGKIGGQHRMAAGCWGLALVRQGAPQQPPGAERRQPARPQQSSPSQARACVHPSQPRWNSRIPLLAGAQCAHAAVGAVERLRGRRQAALLRRWEACGQPKICLQAASTQVRAPRTGGGGWQRPRWLFPVELCPAGLLLPASQGPPRQSCTLRSRSLGHPDCTAFVAALRAETCLAAILGCPCLPPQELRQLAAAAAEAALPTFIVQDAGEAAGKACCPGR